MQDMKAGDTGYAAGGVQNERRDMQQGGGEDEQPEELRKLFIGGLTAATTEEMLRDVYSSWGEIVDCVVMKDRDTKRSRGFGFISYRTQQEVDEAMKNRPHVVDHKVVDPKRAIPREKSLSEEACVSTKRLYVAGVREEHTEHTLQDYFSQYGAVVKVEVIEDKATGKPRGFAFVTFDDYDAVDKCVMQKSHMIANYRCDVKKALSKEEMNRARQQDRERMARGTRARGSERSSGRGGGGSWNAPSYGVGYAGNGSGYSSASGTAYGGGGGGQGTWGGTYSGGYGAPAVKSGWAGADTSGWTGAQQQPAWNGGGDAGWGAGGTNQWQGAQTGGQSWDVGKQGGAVNGSWAQPQGY